MFTSLETDRNFSLFRSLFRAIFVSARGTREDEIACVESDNDGGKKKYTSFAIRQSGIYWNELG